MTSRVPLVALLSAALALGGCGLFQEEIGFRTYPLRDVPPDEGAALVRDVVERFVTERFGGIGITWDPVTRNIAVDPVEEPGRRLWLRIHLEPRADGLDVEMFALVEHLVAGRPGRIWGDPKQDVPLEEMLYEAILAEYLQRREPE